MSMRSRQGVTLIELIIAMAILLAVSVPMGAMISAQIRGMMTSTDLTAAGNLARQKMEGLINVLSNPLTYASVVTGSSTVGSYDLAWTVTPVVSGAVERKDITLTANRTGTAPILVALYGSVTKNVSYAP